MPTLLTCLVTARERGRVYLYCAPRKVITPLTMVEKAVIQGMRAEEIISRFKQGLIRRQFPAQFLAMTFEEIQAAAQANAPGARTALKLLLNGRFDKS